MVVAQGWLIRLELAVTLAVEVRSLSPCADEVNLKDNPNRGTRDLTGGSTVIMCKGESGESR